MSFWGQRNSWCPIGAGFTFWTRALAPDINGAQWLSVVLACEHSDIEISGKLENSIQSYLEISSEQQMVLNFRNVNTHKNEKIRLNLSILLNGHQKTIEKNDKNSPFFRSDNCRLTTTCCTTVPAEMKPSYNRLIRSYLISRAKAKGKTPAYF
jgi:hypothetical protein